MVLRNGFAVIGNGKLCHWNPSHECDIPLESHSDARKPSELGVATVVQLHTSHSCLPIGRYGSSFTILASVPAMSQVETCILAYICIEQTYKLVTSVKTSCHVLVKRISLVFAYCKCLCCNYWCLSISLLRVYITIT